MQKAIQAKMHSISTTKTYIDQTQLFFCIEVFMQANQNVIFLLCFKLITLIDFFANIFITWRG